MRQRGCWRFDALFGGDFQSAVQCELNFARGFLTRIAMRHDARPFDNLGDETGRRLSRPSTKWEFRNREDLAAFRTVISGE